MKLKLLDYRVVNLNLESIEQDSSLTQQSNELDLQVGQFYPEDKDNIFGVGFRVAFKQDGYALKVEMRFFFETDDIITDEFKNSSFPVINAPAIAFPYLRSFLSIITMQSGYPPVMLPSINFVEFAKNAQKV
ncbi:protein-export chaperone SecB [uncultured Duncaniella sp.]|uniref:protein-export chaperone SecB n=1 Tax=uncultured Duncaniella sp. TaxID=2768039 RepID=UPI002676DF40|nr:protein-export chaperone SecB [uncultured Duncaniella sp.]